MALSETWAGILSKVPSTQRADIATHPAASFDKLAGEIATANNIVVQWQACRDKFEVQVADERAKIAAELEAAEAALAEKRLAWDAQADARGLRGVLPVAVSKATGD